VAETQLHELPFQCSMMPVPRPSEDPANPTAQASRAELAVTLARKPSAGLGTSAQDLPFQRSMTVSRP
jgi:hypothetical protein